MGLISQGDVPALTRAIAAGDADAFERLYRAWFPRAVALVRAATGRDEAFALDVAQDAMLRAARRLPVLADDAALSAWMTRTTLSIAIDALRAEARRHLRERASGPPRAPAAPTEAEWLREAMGSLGQLDYELVRAKLAQARTMREAALAVRVGEPAAQGRVRRALERLRRLAGEIVP